jgi:hypothetical protein
MANYSTPNADKIRTITRSAYDFQQVRVDIGNRIVANFREKLGIPPGEEAEEEAEEILAELRQRWRKITDGVVRVTRRKKYDFDGVITTYAELGLLSNYFQIEKREQDLFRSLGYALDGVPIWEEFLDDVKGVGPAMAGCIISELDPHRAPYPSSFHAYCGLDVADDGKARSRRSEHLVEHKYTDSEGKEQTRKGLSFNPFIRTKLLGVLGPSFLRAGKEDNPYRDEYDRYRHRIENMDKHADKSDGHIHNMAIRKMVKHFVVDTWLVWRDLEDLPLAKPYAVKYLGKNDHGREERLGITNPTYHEDVGNHQ